MKNAKLFPVVLAAVMSFQQVAYAVTDRTAGIEVSAVRDAKAEIAQLRGSLIALDQTLQQTSALIVARDSDGRLANGVAIAGAGIGVAAGLFAAVVTYSASLDSGGAGVGLIATAVGSLVAGVAGAVGTSAYNHKTDIQSENLVAKADQIQSEIKKQLAVEQDQKKSELLRNLSGVVDAVKANADSFKAGASQESKWRAGLAITNGIVVAMSAGGLVASPLAFVTPIAATAANIAQLYVMLSPEKIKELLGSINATRGAIFNALGQLQ